MDANLSHIYRHADSVAHIKIAAERNMNEKKTDEDNITDNLLLQFEERKKAAEIRYAAFITERQISYQTAEEILKFFQEIGKDSKVL